MKTFWKTRVRILEAGGIERCVVILETGDSSQPFADYAEFASRGQDAAMDVIRYFWKFPVFFGFQSRGKMRKDIMRLLSSDVHSPYELKALTLMRNTLNKYEEQPVAA